MDPVFKSYFNFSNGSSWVYVLLSDTNTKENLTAVQRQEGVKEQEGLNKFNEFFEYLLKSDKETMLQVRALADEKQTSFAAFHVWTKNTSGTGADSMFRLGADVMYGDGKFVPMYTRNDEVKMHDQLVIDGKVYKDILEIKLAQSFYYTRLIFQKNVGLLRRELKDGKIYQLKNYKLN